MSIIPSPLTSYCNCSCVNWNGSGAENASTCAITSSTKSISVGFTCVAGLPIISAIALISEVRPRIFSSNPDSIPASWFCISPTLTFNWVLISLIAWSLVNPAPSKVVILSVREVFTSVITSVRLVSAVSIWSLNTFVASLIWSPNVVSTSPIRSPNVASTSPIWFCMSVVLKFSSSLICDMAWSLVKPALSKIVILSVEEVSTSVITLLRLVSTSPIWSISAVSTSLICPVNWSVRASRVGPISVSNASSVVPRLLESCSNAASTLPAFWLINVVRLVSKVPTCCVNWSVRSSRVVPISVSNASSVAVSYTHLTLPTIYSV